MEYTETEIEGVWMIQPRVFQSMLAAISFEALEAG